MAIVAFLIAFFALLVAALAIYYARRTATRADGTARPRRRRMRGRVAPLFRLERISPHRYILRNEGGLTAYDVRLDTGDVVVHEGPLTFRDFPAGHREEYLLIQPMHGHRSEIALAWRFRHGDATEHVTQLPLDTGVESEGQEA